MKDATRLFKLEEDAVSAKLKKKVAVRAATMGTKTTTMRIRMRTSTSDLINKLLKMKALTSITLSTVCWAQTLSETNPEVSSSL